MADEDKKDAVKADDTRKKGYYICKGKSLTSKKGILNEGDGPYEKSLFGDDDNIKRLVKLKVLELQK